MRIAASAGRKRFHSRVLAFILGAFLLAACWPTPNTGEVLFQDDFSDAGSGWDRLTVATGEANYVGGFYRIFVNQPNTDVLASPGLSFQDVRLEVDAVMVGGSEDNNFGLICRKQDNTNYYFFMISSDGYYGIGKSSERGKWLIGIEAMQPSELIQQGQSLNKLRADCVGDTLTLYINGQRLAEVQDEDFTSGDVGLIAGAYDTPGTDIRFDNFSALKP